MKKLLTILAVGLILAFFSEASMTQTAQEPNVGIRIMTPEERQKYDEWRDREFWGRLNPDNILVISPDGKSDRANAWIPPGLDPSKIIMFYFSMFAVGGNTIYGGPYGVDVINGYALQIFELNLTPVVQQDWAAFIKSDGSIPTLKAKAYPEDTTLSNVPNGYNFVGSGFIVGMLTASLPGGPIMTGWWAVAVTKDTNGQPGMAVSGALVHLTNGVVDGRAAVLPVTPTQSWSMAVNRFATEETGISIANPDPANTANLTFTVRDPLGTVVGTKSMTLLPLNQNSLYVSQLVNLPVGFWGSMDCVSDVPVVPMAVQTSGFNFSTGVIARARQQ